jgi:hypothetical protein
MDGAIISLLLVDMVVGLREYGTYDNGASVYKDKKGFYIVDWNGKNEYKKYLKHWKPMKPRSEQLCLVGKRWTLCKKNKKKNKKNTRKTRKLFM